MKVLIITHNKEWGGSEHLWFESIDSLIFNGFNVHVMCNKSMLSKNRLALLLNKCDLTLDIFYPKRKRILFRFIGKLFGLRISLDKRIHHIEKTRPDFVLVNQGLNFDAFDLLGWLSNNSIRYGIISHAVDHRRVFNKSTAKYLRDGFSNSVFNGFVSDSNIRQTSRMIGMEIPNVRLFRNPVSLPNDTRNIPYPNTDQGFRLAFVGRLDFKVKGQDLLLGVLRQPKWCNRNLSVRFYGDGPDKQKLEEMLLDFPQGKHVYGGFKSPFEIWSENHALVLTSHFEGLPIVIVEAGLCGRTCLVTNVSGNAELLSDNVDGFVAKTDTADAIDEALERAWVHRFEWLQMGELLRQKMINTIPKNPGQILADTILEQVQC